ncbi:flagellar hook-length control protein FliK [Piscinibacter sp. XHJ-5]|uniref:flagellar hook-length control protein FliK n=1 Tax=Piscinibacter sp. XHJ-5 TaxID=3037797 RepID=UPI002452CD4C|nr:flagellar hook-length control protein FliK [Piscinibacter sp. XHJ-5]
MQISTPAPLVATGPSPTNTAGGPPATGGEPSPFAKLLTAQQSKPGAAGSNERPALDEQQPDASEDGKPVKASAARRAGGRATGKADLLRDAGDGAKPDDAAASLAATDKPSVDAATDPERDAAPANASPCEWFAAFHPVAATPLQAATAGLAEAKADTAELAADPARLVGVHAGRGRGTNAAAGKIDETTDRRAEALPSAAEAQLRSSIDMALALPAREVNERVEARVEPASRMELPATHAAASPLRAESAPSTPAVVQLATPANAPEFRDALAVQVSVLAKDGVQHAELHLNPAEMGPISVQIALQGTQAQVDFGAESFATRQIIEAGLPELAAALRDAGFTLAGGGVSQQSRGQSQGDGSSPGFASRKTDKEELAVRPVTVRTRQGGVDLYA